jgi:hypothetical protein
LNNDLPPFYQLLVALKSLDPDIERFHVTMSHRELRFHFHIFRGRSALKSLEFSIAITEDEMREICASLEPREIREGIADRKLVEWVEAKFREIVGQKRGAQ